MNERDVEMLLVRGMQSPDFFAKVLRDPKGAACDLGIAINDKEAAAMRTSAQGIRKRATWLLSYPLPKISGTPGGTPKPRPSPPKKKPKK